MKGVNFRIDPEFAGKIPPIGEEEYAQLRENILAAGEVYEPLVVWKEENILVDGHNRWKVIQETPSVTYHIREMSFADKWAAFDWMYRNQLGRRNLTDEQRTYAIGKMYEARKNTQGGDRRSEDFSNTQNGNLKIYNRQGTAGKIANELHIGNNTVIRAEKFAKGVDALREVNPEAADKVLNGKAKVTKLTVAEIANLERDKVVSAADAIINPVNPVNPIQPKKKHSTTRTKEDRELAEIISAAVASQTDIDGGPAFGIDELIGEIEVNGENYVRGLRSTISIRTGLLKDADSRMRVFRAIANIVQEIIKVRSEFVK